MGRQAKRNAESGFRLQHGRADVVRRAFDGLVAEIRFAQGNQWIRYLKAEQVQSEISLENLDLDDSKLGLIRN